MGLTTAARPPPPPHFLLWVGATWSHSLILSSKNGKWKSASTKSDLGALRGNPFRGSLLQGMESQERVSCSRSRSKFLPIPTVSGLFEVPITSPSVVDLDSSQKSWKGCKGAPHGWG